MEKNFTWKIPNFDLKMTYTNKFELDGIGVILDLVRTEEIIKRPASSDYHIYASVPYFYFENIPSSARKLFKFSIKTARGGKTCERDFTEIQEGTLKLLNPIKHFLRGRDSTKALVENGELTLIINAAIKDADEVDNQPKMDENTTKPGNTTTVTTKSGERTSVRSGKLTQANSDFTFTIGRDSMWTVHKKFISNYSPVLAKIIVEAGSSKEAAIKGVARGAFTKVINYLYTGGILIIQNCDYLEDLLLAAEKLQVEGLKAECEAHAQRMLNRSNAAALFKVAVKHRCESLKEAILSLADKSLEALTEQMYTREFKTAEDAEKIFATIKKLESVIDSLPLNGEASGNASASSPVKGKVSKKSKRKKVSVSGSLVPIEGEEESGKTVPVKEDASTQDTLIDTTFNVLKPTTDENIGDKPVKTEQLRNQTPAAPKNSRNNDPRAAKAAVAVNSQSQRPAGKRVTIVKRRHPVLDPAELLGDYACELFDEASIEEDTGPREKLGSLRDFMSSLS